jgi:molybdopterin converting factor small subunit
MDLVRILAAKHRAFGKKAFADPKQSFFDYCAVILNGKFISAPAELDTKLKEGDTITLSPAFYGG